MTKNETDLEIVQECINLAIQWKKQYESNPSEFMPDVNALLRILNGEERLTLYDETDV